MHEGHDLTPLEPRTLMAVDPVTPNNPVWFATYGTPRVDGAINAAEWAGTVPIVRAQPNKAESSVTIRMMYNENALFIAADVRDQFLWSDGNGWGSGGFWEATNDDSLGFYFDPNNSFRRALGPAGRMLEMNIGAFNGALSGSGRVFRQRYLMGDGAGFGTSVNLGGPLSPGMTWRIRLQGTVNNNADRDVGYTMEIRLPWSSINMPGMPVNGQVIGMNFLAYFDDDGGVRNYTNYEHSTDPNMRFGPRTLDDKVAGVDSSLNTPNPGFNGPINYAGLVFVDPRAADRAGPINALSVSAVTGYGAQLTFNAPRPGENRFQVNNRGGALRYEIRVSNSPIDSEDAWNAASVVRNAFVPKAAGVQENLRIGSLTPGTAYHVAVRAVDAAGRPGAMATTSFTTLTPQQDQSAGERIIPAPGGGGLVTESGEPFVITMNSAVYNSRYVRNLYPGDQYDVKNNRYINYTVTPGREGPASGWFDSLAANGVTTLRVPLEWTVLPDIAKAQAPRGMAWLEYPAGNFNPNARTFLHNLIDEASRVGIRLVLHPFGTFNYKTNFDLTPWAARNGGPLTDINNFFQTPQVLTMAINRMRTVIDWVNQSSSPHTVMGMELVNEFDAWQWTLNAKGNADPTGTRTPEMRDRALFMTRLARAVHDYDSRVNVFSSSIGLIPRGPVARALFLSDAFDVLAPHYYTASTSEPIYSPDADKSVRPATDIGALAQYWMTQRRDNRHIYNGEWGMINRLWPNQREYYTGITPVQFTDPSRPWTLAQDVALYRTTTWTSIAAGLGTGNRLDSIEFNDLVPSNIGPETTGFLPLPLPQGMRNIQKSVVSFFTDTRTAMDWAHFDAQTLAGRIRFAGPSSLIGIGSVDAATLSRGLLYVLQDTNRTRGTVASSTVTLDGLAAGRSFTFEAWSTGTDANVIATITGVSDANGRVSIALPAFANDVMFKFAAA
jgi:hypothetical protein